MTEEERHIGHDIWDYVKREYALIQKKESQLPSSERQEIIKLYKIGNEGITQEEQK